MFLTSQGHAYAHFRRALDTGNGTMALAAAADLPHVALADALELCLVLRDSRPDRFERAALRRHGRFCRETSDVTLDEAQAVLVLLASLPGPRGKTAARALGELLDRRGLERAARALLDWGNR